MRLIKGLPSRPLYENGCVLTIGNFDGVHLGHRAVIEKLADKAKQLDLPVVIMLFEPQPLEFFLRETAPPRLTRLREKICRLAQLPVADLLIVRFNKKLADYDADKFIAEVLINKLNVKYLVIGDDFRFGKDRRGDFALLQSKGDDYGFIVEDTGTFQLDRQRVSSSLIRTTLADGDLTTAAGLLGYPYTVCGRVVHGDKLGRQLGFPTANIALARKKSPVSGVFAVTVAGIDKTDLAGVANVGVRPTIDGSNKMVLEVHLFNFNREIYNRQLAVQFRHKIRAERQFQTIEELRAQIEDDITKAKQYFALRQQ
jgi:riboflavin kinase / FMN adenylyltransferase